MNFAKLTLFIGALTLMVAYVVPLTVSAACVNYKDTVTGTTCFTVNGQSGSGGSGSGTVTKDTNTTCGNCNLGYVPLEPVPGLVPTGSQLTLPNLLGSIYKIAVVVGALFSVLMLTISGIRYMLSDVVTDKERAKLRIKACIYGLLLIGGSYLVLYTINPKLLEFRLAPGSATISSSGNSVGIQQNAQTAQQRAAALASSMATCAKQPPQVMSACYAALGIWDYITK